MDVLFTLGMLGLMVASMIVLGRAWPRSSRGGGYRAGRGYGARGRGTPSVPPGAELPVPEEGDIAWRWRDGPDRPDEPEAGGSAR